MPLRFHRLSNRRLVRAAGVLATTALVAGGIGGVLPGGTAAPVAAQETECPFIGPSEIEEIYRRVPLRVGVETRFEADAGSSAIAEQTQCEFVFVEDNPLEGSVTATLTKGAFHLEGGGRYAPIFDTSSGATQVIEGLGDQAVVRIIRLEGLPPVIGQLDVRLGADMLTATLRLPAAEIDDDGVTTALRAVIERMIARLSGAPSPAAAPAPTPNTPPADDPAPAEEGAPEGEE